MPVYLTPEQLAARNKRSLWIALGLVAFIVLIFTTTFMRMQANLTAHGGSMALGNVLSQVGVSGRVDMLVNAAKPLGNVTLADGVTLDASGLWSNLELDPFAENVAYASGGSVAIRASGDVALQRGSTVD
eukprot:gene10152-13589_t